MPVIETKHCPASRAHHQTCRPWERRKYLDFKTLEGDSDGSYAKLFVFMSYLSYLQQNKRRTKDKQKMQT